VPLLLLPPPLSQLLLPLLPSPPVLVPDPLFSLSPPFFSQSDPPPPSSPLDRTLLHLPLPSIVLDRARSWLSAIVCARVGCACAYIHPPPPTSPLDCARLCPFTVVCRCSRSCGLCSCVHMYAPPLAGCLVRASCLCVYKYLKLS
jgi:hypothetical protein